MPQEVSSSNKRIAKNAVLLYLRTALTAIIGLYTSRIVLNVLGVENYGIYGVVGGIVGFMGFLNGTMSGATSRFITYALGKGELEKLKSTFISAFWVHLVIAAIILIISETIGLWFLYNKLVIPEGRMDSAFWVYQLSIASTLISITQVPYNASIISHEDFDIFAYSGIAITICRLLIVYLLQIGSFDKLILYAFLYFSVTAIFAMFYRWYSIKHYNECKLKLTWDKSLIKQMLYFCGWDLYGNFSVTTKNQGRTLLINMFFGVAMNAAATIANSVVSIVNSFTNSISQAFKPQIIKQYSCGNIMEMQKLATNSIKYSLLLMSLMIIPLLFEAPYVFSLWLGIVPDYTVDFCRIILLGSCLDLIIGIINTIIHATGNIKRLSFISGTLYWVNLPIIYLFFLCNLDATYAYLLDILSFGIIIMINLNLAKQNIPQMSRLFFLQAILITILTTIPAVLLSCLIHYSVTEGFARLTIVIIASGLSTSLITYFFLFDQATRVIVQNKLLRFRH